MSTPSLDTSVADPALRYAALPLIGRRRLTDEERGRLKRIVNRRWRQAGGCVGLVAAFLGFLAVVPENADESVMSLALVVGCAVLAWGVLVWWESHARIEQARRDLANGWVWVFEGPVVVDEQGTIEARSLDSLASGRLLNLGGVPRHQEAVDVSVQLAIERQFGPRTERTAAWWREPAAEVTPSERVGRLWCETLPLVAERPLFYDERLELERQVWNSKRRAVAYTVTPVVGFVVAGCLLPLVPGPPMMPVLVMLPVLALLGMSCARALSNYRSIQPVQRELDIGRMLVFERTREFTPGDSACLSLEVLGGGTVWAVNGWRSFEPIGLPFMHVAPTPPRAAQAAQFMMPEQFASGQVAQANHRPLSPEEREELARMLRRHRSGASSAASVLTVLGVCYCLRGILNGTAAGWLGILVALLLARPLMRSMRAQRGLEQSCRRDLDVGVVVQLQPREWPEEARAAGVPLDAEFVELLPSGNVWSIAGQPSAWRLQA